MPATWGYGNAGTEPGQMTGWGYLSNLALLEGIFSAEEVKTSYRDEEIESSYSAVKTHTTYTARSDEE